MWPCYLINLDKDRMRLDRAGGELDRAGLAWERLPAVNGRSLSEAELHRHYDAKAAQRFARYPLLAPEIGCYLSHRAAWQRLLDQGTEGAIILEDDLRITGDLAAVAAALVAQPGWDIAKLFSFKPIRFVGAVTPLTDSVRLGVPERVPSTTLGYAITRDGAARALAASERFFRPIDEDHKFFWELGLRIKAVDPSPLATGLEETAEGTIGQARRAHERPRSKLAQSLRNARYQLRYRIGLLRWRLAGRK